jgi:hypothetical protein
MHGKGTGEGYIRLGSSELEEDSQNTDIEWPKCYFGPTSIVPCHNCVGAVAYVRGNCSSKLKLLSVPKRTHANTGDTPNRLNPRKTLFPKVSAP